MPRASNKEVPAVPSVPVTPSTPEVPDVPVTELGSVVKVKHHQTGKTYEVSRAYYEDNKAKLDVIA